MAKRKTETKEKKRTAVPVQSTEQNTVWATVTGAAVDFMEAQGDEPLTKAEIVQGIIDSHKATLVPVEKIEELVEAMLFLFVKNNILINNAGVYTKRTLQDVMPFSNGIVIERAKQDGKAN